MSFCNVGTPATRPRILPPHLAKPSSRLISRLLPTFLSVANRHSIDCSVPSTRRPAPSTRCATNRALGMVAHGYRQSLSKKPGMRPKSWAWWVIFSYEQ